MRKSKNMNLPRVDELDVFGQKVLLRMDVDVPVEDGKVLDDTRLRASIPTIKYLIEEGAESIVVLGHRGRPGGKTVQELSLSPVAKHLEKLLEKEIGKKKLHEFEIQMAENLRFMKGEESFDSADTLGQQDKAIGESFVQDLAVNGDVYINDAFAASNREHASIVGLPEILPSAAGFSVIHEVESLEKILKDPKKPVVAVLGGGKVDKAVFIPKFLEIADWVLVGGLLAKHAASYCTENERGGVCVVGAHLTPQGHDINPDSAKNFVEIIKSANTIVWGGPMGDIDGGFWDGTKVVGSAIGESSAFKVAGGGDTIHAINELGIQDKFDHISTGGGAMLEFLAYGDLPGLRALRGE